MSKRLLVCLNCFLLGRWLSESAFTTSFSITVYPRASPPRTVAFGWNGEMTILDIKSMLDIERFRKINIRAKGPEEVYRGKNLAPECNIDFLRRCVRWIPVINFANYKTGAVYARVEHGKWVWRDDQDLACALNDPDAKAGLWQVMPMPMI